MWAHVGYTCDREKADVPISFFKDYEIISEELSKGCVRKSYYVFWSDKKGDTPESIRLRDGRVLIVDRTLIKKGAKQNEVIAGYYEAALFCHARSLAELKVLTKSPKSRRSMRPTVETCDDFDKPLPSKTTRNRAAKQLKEQARKKNLNINDDVSTLSDSASESQININSSYSDKTEVDSKTEKTSNSIKSKRKVSVNAKEKIKTYLASQSDESDFSPEEDQEVVPASELQSVKEHLQQAKGNLRVQKSFVSKLTVELQAVTAEKEKLNLQFSNAKESLERFKTEATDLKNQIKSLMELNRMWQEKEMSRSSKRSHSSLKDRHSSSHREEDKGSSKKRKISYEIKERHGNETKTKEASGSLLSNDETSKEENGIEETMDDFSRDFPPLKDLSTSEGFLMDLDPMINSGKENDVLKHIDNTDSAVTSDSIVQSVVEDLTSPPENISITAPVLKPAKDLEKPAAGQLAKPDKKSFINKKPLEAQLEKSLSKKGLSRGGIKLCENDFKVEAPKNGPTVSYEMFMTCSKGVKVGQHGDSQFVKDICEILWTKEQMAVRCSAGKLCPNKYGAEQKKECTPEKKKYLQDLLTLRIDCSITPVSPDAREKRTSMKNVMSILRSKLMTVSRAVLTNNPEGNPQDKEDGDRE